MRAKLGKAAAAKDTDRLGEQPAELVDRLRLRLVLGEVLLDELLQRQRAADTLLPAELFERPFKRFPRITLRGEASPLQPSRTRAVGPVPIRPDRAAVDGASMRAPKWPRRCRTPLSTYGGTATTVGQRNSTFDDASLRMCSHQPIASFVSNERTHGTDESERR